MFKVVKVVLIVVIVLFVMAVAAQFTLSRIATRSLQRTLPRLTGTAATVEALRLSPFTGAGEIIGLRIPNPEGFAEPEALRLDRARVQVDLWSLLRPTLVVREVSVNGARVCYERRADGKDNLSWLRERMASGAAQTLTKPDEPAPGGAPQAMVPAKSPRKLIVDSLIVTNCRVRVAGVLSTNVMELPLPTIALQNLGRAQGGLTQAELGAELIRTLTASAVQAALQPGSQAQELIRNLMDTFRKHNMSAKPDPQTDPAPVSAP